LRDSYQDIRAAGADLVAIGTGDQRYATRFVEDESIPFAVLVDDHAEAARFASVNRGSIPNILTPSTYRDSIGTWRRGHRIHKSGKRVLQLGATFIVGPGDRVAYEHIDATTTDHAPIDEVLSALARGPV
jgi:peroxiredoxin